MPITFRKFCSTASLLILSSVLSACAFTEDSLWPILSDEEETQTQNPAQNQVTMGASETGASDQIARAEPSSAVVPDGSSPARDSNALPLLGASFFESPGVTEGQRTGTAVGDRIERLRTDLARLQARLVHHNKTLQAQRHQARKSAATYQTQIAAISARLQVGTTPGNPVLVSQWNTAQGELESVSTSITQLNSLSNEASNTAALSAFVLDSARATYDLRGALEEDHRQLGVLEDEANQTVVILDRLQNELTEDIIRTQNFFSNERSNLTALQIAVDSGEIIGNSLSSRVFGLPVPPSPNGAAGLVGRQTPLAIIRFDQPDIRYQQALYTAINRTLDARPGSAFDIVTVAPPRGTVGNTALATAETRRYGEDVLRSLTNLGLPANRLTLSSTSNPGARVPEVHIYVR